MDGGASLFANSVGVDGNIQTVGPAARMNVSPGSFVGGSIQIKQSGAADIRGVDIDGDLQFDDNTGFLDAVDNIIGGNLQVFQNTGGVAIIDNRIGGNLQYKENDPLPTGGGNIVQGSMEDQCANFDLAPSPATPSTATSSASKTSRRRQAAAISSRAPRRTSARISAGAACRFNSFCSTRVQGANRR